MPERKLMLAHAAHYKVGTQSKMIHSASGVTHAHARTSDARTLMRAHTQKQTQTHVDEYINARVTHR